MAPVPTGNWFMTKHTKCFSCLRFPVLILFRFIKVNNESNIIYKTTDLKLQIEAFLKYVMDVFF